MAEKEKREQRSSCRDEVEFPPDDNTSLNEMIQQSSRCIQQAFLRRCSLGVRRACKKIALQASLDYIEWRGDDRTTHASCTSGYEVHP